MSIKETLQQKIRCLEEAIEYEELSDYAFCKNYTYLVREKKALEKTLKQYEKYEKLEAGRVAWNAREAKAYVQ